MNYKILYSHLSESEIKYYEISIGNNIQKVYQFDI